MEDFTPLALLQIIGILVVNILYGGLILQLIQKNQTKYKNEYAESSIYLTLDWLKYLVIFLVIMSIIICLMIIFSQYFSKLDIPFLWIELLFLLMIMATSYFAFRQPTLYSEPITKISGKTESEEVKDLKPLIDERKINSMTRELEVYLLEKKPFLNPKIKMPEIAAAIEFSPNEFSWYLNEYKKTNFFAFINELRVTHAVELLKTKEYDHYTLEAIGKMAGFQSNTTFYNRFKEIENVTPSKFRKSLNT